MQALGFIFRGEGESGVGEKKKGESLVFLWGVPAWSKAEGAALPAGDCHLSSIHVNALGRGGHVVHWTEPHGDLHEVYVRCHWEEWNSVHIGPPKTNKDQELAVRCSSWDGNQAQVACVWIPPPLLVGPGPVYENHMIGKNCHGAPLGSTSPSFHPANCTATSSSMCKGGKQSSSRKHRTPGAEEEEQGPGVRYVPPF